MSTFSGMSRPAMSTVSLKISFRSTLSGCKLTSRGIMSGNYDALLIDGPDTWCKMIVDTKHNSELIYDAVHRCLQNFRLNTLLGPRVEWISYQNIQTLLEHGDSNENIRTSVEHTESCESLAQRGPGMLVIFENTIGVPSFVNTTCNFLVKKMYAQ